MGGRQEGEREEGASVESAPVPPPTPRLSPTKTKKPGKPKQTNPPNKTHWHAPCLLSSYHVARPSTHSDGPASGGEGGGDRAAAVGAANSTRAAAAATIAAGAWVRWRGIFGWLFCLEKKREREGRDHEIVV